MDVDHGFQPEQPAACAGQPAARHQFADAQHGDLLGPQRSARCAAAPTTRIARSATSPPMRRESAGVLRQEQGAQQTDAMHLERRAPVELPPALNRPAVAIVLPAAPAPKPGRHQTAPRCHRRWPSRHAPAGMCSRRPDSAASLAPVSQGCRDHARRRDGASGQ